MPPCGGCRPAKLEGADTGGLCYCRTRPPEEPGGSARKASMPPAKRGTPAPRADARDRALEPALREALTRGGFELHYQPKVLRRGIAFVGFEALLRWRHPERGLLPPGQFVPLAERLGLGAALGRWVIEEACRQMAAWEREGAGQVRVSVNLSASQLRDPKFPAELAAILARHGLGPERLELEVTEAMLMALPRSADGIAALKALRAAGATLAIDDFGSGWTSLEQLKQLPVARLKLDRRFVQRVDRERRDAELCAGVTALAHKLGIGVVAEGVESARQAEVLAEGECDQFQGFLFGRPQPGAEAGALARAALTPRTPPPSS